MDTRLESLKTWLNETLNTSNFSIERASEDASFRRYFRVTNASQTLIAMDAPPDKENSEPFVRISQALSELAVHTPAIYAHDLSQGFLLLEDLGQTDYLSALNNITAHNADTANRLYSDAIKALISIQKGNPTDAAPYSKEKLAEEMDLFPTWFLERHLNQTMSSTQSQVWRQTSARLIKVCLEQPQVWVHRDFHSRNLMVVDSNNPGVIDFQDLVVGPISYDLASIFKDCYIEWPRNRQLAWLKDYYTQLDQTSFSYEQLVRWYDLTGFQRHLKVLGIFCRLNYRDAKERYLDDLPLVAKYCLEVLELYPELDDFKREFSSQISTALTTAEKHNQCIRQGIRKA